MHKSIMWWDSLSSHSRQINFVDFDNPTLDAEYKPYIKYGYHKYHVFLESIITCNVIFDGWMQIFWYSLLISDKISVWTWEISFLDFRLIVCTTHQTDIYTVNANKKDIILIFNHILLSRNELPSMHNHCLHCLHECGFASKCDYVKKFYL